MVIHFGEGFSSYLSRATRPELTRTGSEAEKKREMVAVATLSVGQVSQVKDCNHGTFPPNNLCKPHYPAVQGLRHTDELG